MADSETVENLEPESTGAPTRFVWKAYLLWFCAGGFGAHRMYLHRWRSAFAYVVVMILMIITIEVYLFYVFLLAWTIDLFLIPHMTKACNAKLESEFAEHPERFVFASDDEIAPWARDQRTGFFWFLGAPIRLFHFIVWPMVFTFIMVFTGNHEFVVFPVIILLATGLIHSLDQITARHPSLMEIPGMESAILRVQELRQYYWDHEPHLRGSLWGMIRRARTEYAPYWKIAGIVVLAVVIDSIFSFEDDYASHLSVGDALVVVVVHSFLLVFAVMLILAPLSALSFHYSLAGQHRTLRAFTVTALAMIGVTFFLSMWVERNDDGPTVLSGVRLDLRMEQREFWLELRDHIGMFLLYDPHTGSVSDSSPPTATCNPEKDVKPCEPTSRLRKLLKGIAPNDEAEAFEVFDHEYIDDSNMPSLWRGVQYEYGMDCFTLAMESDGVWCDTICKRIKDLPAPVESSEVIASCATVNEDELCQTVLKNYMCKVYTP